jgi:hypothetical protein
MADSQEPPEAQVQTVAEVGGFTKWLKRAVTVMLEDDEDSLPESLLTALQEKSSIEAMKKFLGDQQTPVLLIQKLATKGVHPSTLL